MPFDLLDDRRTLADAMSHFGVTPVPPNVLEAHKKEQIRRHPPSFMVTPYPYVGIGILSAGGALAATLLAGTFQPCVLLLAAMLGGAAFVISFFLVATFCDIFRIGLLGKPRWVKHHVSRLAYYNDIPEPILRVAKHVDSHITVSMSYVELVQNRAVLDPYLMARVGREEVCLGIWDGGEVIACATIYGE